MGNRINTYKVNRRSTGASGWSVRKRRALRGLEERVIRVVSLGAIISGAAFCLSSVGVGLSLMLVATVVLAEV
jgi:hypothetical protein